MTPFKNTLVLCFALMISLSSCDENIDMTSALTETESAELIEASLATNSGGLTSNLEDLSSELVSTLTIEGVCDSLYAETVEKDYQGARIQATYKSDVSFELSCNNFNIPTDASFAA